MKKLTFAAFYGKSIISKMIRYFTRSKTYSHIAIVIDDRGGLIEAWPHEGGLKQWTDYSNINKHTPGTVYEVWELEVEDDIYGYCMSFYNNKAGKKIPYDYPGVISFVFKKAVQQDKDKFFCSELAIYPLCMAFSWKTIKAHLVSPRDFVNIIEASGGKLIKNGCVLTAG